MRFWLAFLTLFSLCAANTAQAGPWLREKGRSFTSVSVTASPAKDFGNSSYLEYGLTPKMTIGAEVGSFTSRAGNKTGYGTIFMRRALGANTGRNRWAYELGVGTAWVGDLMLPHVKTGLTWGRGFTLKEKSGWMTVDASMTWGVSHSEHIAKVDATLGMNFSDKTSGMLQLYMAHLDSKFYAKIAPSVVIRPGKSKFKLQIGAEIPTDDMKNAAIKLGIWREF